MKLARIYAALSRGPEVRVLLNSNVKMSRGKACAQAVHAALLALDVPHGRVVVLGGKPDEVAAMPFTVRDAGLTEVDPGTLTAGAMVVDDSRPETAGKNPGECAGRVGRTLAKLARVAGTRR